MKFLLSLCFVLCLFGTPLWAQNAIPVGFSDIDEQVRNLQQLTSWAKHFDYEDIDDLRQQIITELIFTEKSLEEIKREI